MKVGDLVRHKTYPNELVGIIMDFGKCGLWDTFVLWLGDDEGCWTAKEYLEVVCK